MRYGVIDIGSNAIRMAVRGKEPGARVVKSWREPLRLGTDSFTEGRIGEEKIVELESLFARFSKIFAEYEVCKYKAVATSALRSAENSEDVIRRVHDSSQLKIDLIDGVEESQLVHRAVSEVIDLNETRSLIMDIGGGSVEVIISEGEKIKYATSLCLGTVRMMQKYRRDKDKRKSYSQKIQKKLDKVKEYRKFFIDSPYPVLFIGTGGNLKSIEKLGIEHFKDMRKGFLTLKRITELESLLFSMKYNERVKKLNLRGDRADVILPAIVTVKEFMQFFSFDQLDVPKVGLKEGLLYNFKSLKTHTFI